MTSRARSKARTRGVAASLLQRHLRNAGTSPLRLAQFAGRAMRLLVTGRLFSVIRRHEVHAALYEGYAQWCVEHDRLAEGGSEVASSLLERRNAPRISVLMPVHDPDPRWLGEAIDSVEAQQYPRWQLCIVDDASRDPAIRDLLAARAAAEPRISLRTLNANRGIAVATNEALAMAEGTHVAFLDHDDTLAPDALALLADAFARDPRLRFLYTDEDRLDFDGRRFWPVFKPAWNPDLLLANNYVTHLMACDASLAREINGMRTGVNGAQDWDFALRATERVPSEAIGHLPRVLYHWRSTPTSTAAGIGNKPYAFEAQRRAVEDAVARAGKGGEVVRASHSWRVRPPPIAAGVTVSVVIPTRDRCELLRACVESLQNHENDQGLRVELILVDNGTTDPAALQFLDAQARSGKATVLCKPGPFNFAALANAGVMATSGDVVLLLNNDTQALHRGWLDELVALSLRPEVGAVGALLLYPDTSIQHAGVVLGVNGVSDHFFRGYGSDWTGINGRVQSTQDLSAVSGACLAMRRVLYDEVGGMDETFAVSLNDLDLCLRLRSRGYRVLWTPFVQLLHRESASRGYAHGAGDRELLDSEARLFAQRWSAWLVDDPAYNPNLSRSGAAFSLGTPVAASACRARVTRQRVPGD